MRRLLLPFFALTALLGSQLVYAQEGSRSIELFEGQGEMSPGSIAIEGPDGDSSQESEGWDGSSAARHDGGISLTYEREGGSIYVPASIEGQTVYFIFDTGATLTTLNSKFAKSVGILPGSSAPRVMMQTANGPRASSLGLMRSLQFGGRNHGGVTFTLCDACPSGTYRGKPLVGLLGMNVIGRYKTSFDDGRGIIEMIPSIRYADRSTDIEPWIDVQHDRSVRVGTALRVDATVHNRSARRISNLELRISCSGGTPTVWKKTLSGKGKAKIVQSIHSGNCKEGFRTEVVGGSW